MQLVGNTTAPPLEFATDFPIQFGCFAPLSPLLPNYR